MTLHSLPGAPPQERRAPPSPLHQCQPLPFSGVPPVTCRHCHDGRKGIEPVDHIRDQRLLLSGDDTSSNTLCKRKHTAVDLARRVAVANFHPLSDTGSTTHLLLSSSSQRSICELTTTFSCRPGVHQGDSLARTSSPSAQLRRHCACRCRELVITAECHLELLDLAHEHLSWNMETSLPC